jgi:uncharacterized protein with von Willebrand factor type A (vWA) domain
MYGVLTGFVDQLREAGIPVSMVEAIDAGRGLEHIDLGSRSALKALLGATLVKTDRHYATFESTFDAYFSIRGPDDGSPDASGRNDAARALIAAAGGGAGGESGGDAADLVAALRRGLDEDDAALLAAIVRIAVERLAGIEPGRPVGGAYYLYRVMRQLQIDGIAAEMVDAIEGAPGLERRIRVEEIERRIERFRQQVADEIRRRLVADRGAVAVTRTLRRPLVEDVDLTSATRDELVEVERLVHPLGRRLATRLAQRRTQGNRGRLDIRRTMRSSLSTGGVPVAPAFRRRRRGKPEIVLLSDVSGSVATFARFTMQLVFAISAQFSRVRTFAFIDGIDEVTRMLGPGADFGSAMDRISREAEIVWLDGHSDYGHALRAFVDRHLDDAVSPRTTVLITGDARTNYHDPDVDALATIARRGRGVYWLNPEPARYWDTGDSVMGAYAPWCEQVVEVRTLRQLEAFVERVSLPIRAGAR